MISWKFWPADARVFAGIFHLLKHGLKGFVGAAATPFTKSRLSTGTLMT